VAFDTLVPMAGMAVFDKAGALASWTGQYFYEHDTARVHSFET
jgi:hypothetical protein